jgi:uncharacterized membrane protein YphA (DoxX/SURF4 family)
MRDLGLLLLRIVAGITRAAHGYGFCGQGGFEFSLLLGAVALSLGLTGPGSISIDNLLASKGA